MFKTLKNAFAIPEMRQKMLYTLFIILLYRIGAAIHVPYTDYEAMQSAFTFADGNLFAYLNILSGDAFSKATLFALSISPYITSSIVIQLLTIAIPALERKSKQGEEGQKFLTQLTRIVTVVLGFLTAFGYYMYMKNYGFLTERGNSVFGAFVIILCYAAGASLIMWLAEKINDKGIGNGISMILFANIIAGLPNLFSSVFYMVFPYGTFSSFQWWPGLVMAILTIVVILAIVILTIWVTNSERRIPIQYAKRVVGRKMYGGQNSTLPLKLNMAGVMPIIFASSIATVPATIASFFQGNKFWDGVTEIFGMDTVLYLIVFLLLIVGFSYFYILISFDPVEVANNIQSQGGAIPGIRSGKPTYQYIKKVLNRVTLMGAFFLGFIACFPLLVNMIASLCNYTALSTLAFSGSSLLIIVGVILETERDLGSQVALRNYGSYNPKGFLG